MKILIVTAALVAAGLAALAGWGTWAAFQEDADVQAGALRSSIAEARAFNEFPLFWVGEAYRGHALKEIVRLNYPGARPGEQGNRPLNEVTFTYGGCLIPPGETGCPVPLTIIVSPDCKPAPGEIVDSVKVGAEQTIRGAKVQIVTSGAVIWTQGVTVNIAATDEVSVGQVISALVRLNGDEPAESNEPLGPSEDCQ